MSTIFELTCAEYANYFATIPHKGCGRPKNGTNTSGIRRKVQQGTKMPGVTSHRLIGKTYLLRVTPSVYTATKKIIEEKNK